MDTRSISQSVEVNAPIEDVFKALIQPAAIKVWWQASSATVIAKSQGIWAATWGDTDNPDYVVAARIRVFEAPNKMVTDNYQYKSLEGELPFQAELETCWTVNETETGSQLTVEQSGFPVDPAADDFFAGCTVGWQNTLKGIQDYFA